MIKIGNSGYKAELDYCHSGSTSDHCTYVVCPVGSVRGSYFIEGYGPARFKGIIGHFTWRSSAWYRGTHEIMITGVDGCVYKVGVREDKSLYSSKVSGITETAPETIPGDEWGDYPVTPTPSKTMMYVVIALVLLGTYMILRR